MNKSRHLILLSAAMIMLVWATAELRIHAHSTFLQGAIGPDVIVSNIHNLTRWTAGSDAPPAGHSAYSIGTTSCNVGDENLAWFPNTPAHPVISQNLYRIKDGRIEHLAQAWLKHGFASVNGNACGNCQHPGSSQLLGVNCSDPYGAGLNGNQFGLGPKSEVNATTGVFTMPYTTLTAAERQESGGRLVVPNSDISDNTAKYFVESQYVHPDDAADGNDDNNTSYREVTFNGNLDIFFGGSTIQTEPAINAWKVIHPEVDLHTVDVPDDGRYIVGVLTTPAGDGFHTEVAILNHNSEQSVRSVNVDCCAGSISNPGFNDVDYHAEDYSGADWAPAIGGSQIEWSTETFAQNQNANALRWGTLYSFWFDSEFEPAVITLGMFKPGTVSDVSLQLIAVLLGDINQDGSVNLLDVDPFISLLGSGTYQKEGDMNGDGVVNLLDVDGFISALAGN